ncbi:MAG: putative redox protein [Acidimicrobiaceae bacterium]|nr:putative redox protein [Acidimicrobiaceae bacterium]
MTPVHHGARATGSTGSAAPAYRVDIQAGDHQLVADEPAAAGGGDLGPSPFEFLLSGLVACTGMTLRMYAAHKGWELTSIDVGVRFDTDDDGRSVIERTIAVPAAIPPEQRQRLADVAERTPVTLAIRRGTPITTTFQQRDT